MGFMTRLQMALARFMTGRNGMDNISWHAFCAYIAIIVINLFLGSGLLELLGFALIVYAIFRILSRNIAKRQEENSRYIVFCEKVSREIRQFFLRLKGMKTYKYFRCPGCKNRLRMKRGAGEKTITCPVCRRQFQQRA